jgi:hypothetical protein
MVNITDPGWNNHSTECLRGKMRAANPRLRQQGNKTISIQTGDTL